MKASTTERGGRLLAYFRTGRSVEHAVFPQPSLGIAKREIRYDVFISHASEDKDDVARPLAQELERRGLRVWFDEATLTLGDSLMTSIDGGLRSSRFGIVILSPSFLNKDWPNQELNRLVSLDDGTRKLILPVWHRITRARLAKFSPLLAGRLAVSTSKGIPRIADEVFRAIQTEPAGSGIVVSEPSDPLAQIRAAVLLANGPRELRMCLSQIDRFLELHGHDPEAEVLRDDILGAIGYESAHRAAPRLLPRVAAASILVVAVAAVAAALTGLLDRTLLKPFPPSSNDTSPHVPPPTQPWEAQRPPGRSGDPAVSGEPRADLDILISTEISRIYITFDRRANTVERPAIDIIVRNAEGDVVAYLSGRPSEPGPREMNVTLRPTEAIIDVPQPTSRRYFIELRQLPPRRATAYAVSVESNLGFRTSRFGMLYNDLTVIRLDIDAIGRDVPFRIR
jgi:hypothetical protein